MLSPHHFASSRRCHRQGGFGTWVVMLEPYYTLAIVFALQRQIPTMVQLYGLGVAQCVTLFFGFCCCCCKMYCADKMCGDTCALYHSMHA